MIMSGANDGSSPPDKAPLGVLGVLGVFGGYHVRRSFVGTGKASVDLPDPHAPAAGAKDRLNHALHLDD